MNGNSTEAPFSDIREAAWFFGFEKHISGGMESATVRIPASEKNSSKPFEHIIFKHGRIQKHIGGLHQKNRMGELAMPEDLF